MTMCLLIASISDPQDTCRNPEEILSEPYGNRTRTLEKPYIDSTGTLPELQRNPTDIPQELYINIASYISFPMLFLEQRLLRGALASVYLQNCESAGLASLVFIVGNVNTPKISG